MKRIAVKSGATAALLPLLGDGEWHPLTEVATALLPFLAEGVDPERAASDMASQLRCERMGIRGRDDQQVRFRPDLYLDQTQDGHERSQLHQGAMLAIMALVGLRSFQQLAVHPGQTLNPAQRFWLDKALALVKDEVNSGGD